MTRAISQQKISGRPTGEPVTQARLDIRSYRHARDLSSMSAIQAGTAYRLLLA